MITNIAIGIGSLLVGVAVGWFLLRAMTGGTLRLAKREAEQAVSSAQKEGEALKQKIELDAERDAKKRLKELESEVLDSQKEIKQDQARLVKREEGLEKLMNQLTERQEKLDSIRTDLDAQMASVAAALAES